MFGILPSVVAADLDNDPDQLTLQAFTALSYAEAKRAYDSTKDKTKLSKLMKDPMMRAVEDNTFAIHKERLSG